MRESGKEAKPTRDQMIAGVREAIGRIKERLQTRFKDSILEVRYDRGSKLSPGMSPPFYYVVGVKKKKWLKVFPIKEEQRRLLFIFLGYSGNEFTLDVNVDDQSIYSIAERETRGLRRELSRL